MSRHSGQLRVRGREARYLRLLPFGRPDTSPISACVQPDPHPSAKPFPDPGSSYSASLFWPHPKEAAPLSQSHTNPTHPLPVSPPCPNAPHPRARTAHRKCAALRAEPWRGPADPGGLRVGLDRHVPGPAALPKAEAQALAWLPPPSDARQAGLVRPDDLRRRCGDPVRDLHREGGAPAYDRGGGGSRRAEVRRLRSRSPLYTSVGLSRQMVRGLRQCLSCG